MLTAGAVAVATSVQGQDFDRHAVAEGTQAYEVEWESADPGMLRLSLAPSENASVPTASISLVDEEEGVEGTYELDDEWPRLDVRVEPGEEPVVMVHETREAQLDVLVEEGHPVDWSPIDLATESQVLVSGDRERVNTQIVLDMDRVPVHMGLELDGLVDSLDLTASQEETTVLEATVDHADARAGHRLAPSLDPGAFDDGNVLVKVQADELDGELALTTYHLEKDTPHVVHENESNEDEPRDSKPDKEDGAREQDRASADQRSPALQPLRNVTPGSPVGLALAEDQQLWLASEDEDARLVLFDPDDEVNTTLGFDETTPEEAPNGTHEDRSWASLDLESTGEHVLVLDARENAKLYAQAADRIEHRGLDRIEIQGHAAPNGSSLLSSSSANETVQVEGGVFGFSWTSQSIDVDRDVELVGPSGETLYEASAMSADRAKIASHESAASDPLVGPSGEYSVLTEATSVHDEGIEFTLTVYER